MLELAFAGLDSFTVEDDEGRRLEACQSPVWDTALAAIALLDAGLPREHDAVERSAEWLAGREVLVRGDWAVRRPSLAAGGFPFEFANDNYPDVDDTAVVVLALRRAAGDRFDGPVRARADLGARDAEPRRRLGRVRRREHEQRSPHRLPFCDFGAVTDPPSADVTAHMVELLAHEGLADARRPPATGSSTCSASRRRTARGSAAGARTTSTASARSSRRSRPAGSRSTTSVRRAVAWLERVQNADGGFGEDLRSYREPDGAAAARRPRRRPHGRCSPSTPPAERRRGRRARAIGLLVETQRHDGSWDEPYFTGTGFPGDFYLNYHLYRQVFPVMALGRILGGDDDAALARPRAAPRRGGRAARAARLARAPLGDGAGARARRRGARARVEADAVAIVGVCARGLAGAPAGDVVVATELRARRRRRSVPAGASLVDALRAPRAPGARRADLLDRPLASRGRAAAPRRRRRARGRHGVGVARRRRGRRRPLAVLRVVVDTADRRLLDPRTPAAGVRALANLRRAGGALADMGRRAVARTADQGATR